MSLRAVPVDTHIAKSMFFSHCFPSLSGVQTEKPGIMFLGPKWFPLDAQFAVSSAQLGRRPSRAVLSLLAVFMATCLLVGFVMAILSSAVVEAQSGDLTVEIIAGYNLVVDSNAESPSTFAPSVATVVGRFCNVGASTLTGVQGYIGDYDSGASPTPGIYPSRDSAFFASDHPLRDTGWYTFTHLGGRLGTADATRFVGTLAPHKGVHTAIEALGHLLKDGLDTPIKLTILGGGHPDYEARLHLLVEHWQLAEHVSFHRPIPRAQLPAKQNS